MLVIEGS